MDGTIRPPWDLDDQIKKPVASKTRAFADALFDAIIDGKYRFGTRLPAERVLCDEAGLSRNTVRQALELLSQYAVIKRHAGSGSVVCYRPADTPPAPAPIEAPEIQTLDLSELGETTSPLDLGVVRSIIEPEIARLAVLNMTSRDIRRLNEIQLEIDQVTVDGERFSRLDDALRMQIARGTHNPLLIAMYQMVNQVNHTADWAAQRRKALSPGRIREYRLQNQSLVKAITDREIEATVEYLKLSLADFHQDLTRGL